MAKKLSVRNVTFRKNIGTQVVPPVVPPYTLTRTNTFYNPNAYSQYQEDWWGSCI